MPYANCGGQNRTKAQLPKLKLGAFMLKLMKIMFALVPVVPAPGEAAQRVLGRESEDLSFAPVTANNKCFSVQKTHFTALWETGIIIPVLPAS